MKKIVLWMMTVFLLTACSGKSMQVEVTNPSSSDRNNEIIELSWKTVAGQLTLTPGSEIVVLDENGKQIPYQLLTKGEQEIQSLIFPVSVKADGKSVYTIQSGEPEVFTAMVSGRQVPERKDDFAWENDRIAYRMYGPALANENPSNGVDLWLKRTDELIVDKFYHDELVNKLSYHIDHGQGLDCYKVGHTLGAGGIAPYVDGQLWVGNHYDSYKIIDQGPLRISFELVYDSIPVAEKKVKQTVLISLDAYSQLNKAIVTCENDLDTLQLAAGIFLHTVIGDIKADKEAGYIAYAENAVSDAGLASGRNYVAAILPVIKEIKQDETHLLVLADYKKTEPFIYYFGAGWSKWGFESDEDWFNYVEKYVESLKEPLVVKITKTK